MREIFKGIAERNTGATHGGVEPRDSLARESIGDTQDKFLLECIK